MADEEQKQNESKAEAGSKPAEALARASEEELAELKEKLAMCEKERDEYLNGWRRTKADLANYKNEELARLEDVVKFGNADIVNELTSVLGSFDLAVKSLGGGADEKGIGLIRNQLEEILKRRGMERIAVELGKDFDPRTQEALTEEESDKPPGAVLEVLEQGYMLHGKVLKPARVKVSKNKSG